MKTYGRYFSFALTLLIIFISFSCQVEEDPVSISERIQMFQNNLNSDTTRTDTWTHLHPDTSQRNLYKDGTAWLTTPFTQNTLSYSFSSLTVGSSSAQGVLNATGGDANSWDGDDVEFTMKEDETDVWYILKVTVDPLDVSGGTRTIQ